MKRQSFHSADWRSGARVAELVDAHDSKSCSARSGGSIPSTGTIFPPGCHCPYDPALKPTHVGASGTPAVGGFRIIEIDCDRSQTASRNMKIQLGVIALGLGLAVGMATASWGQRSESGAPNQGPRGAGSWEAALDRYSPPGGGLPDRCFAPSPWGYQWVCG